MNNKKYSLTALIAIISSNLGAMMSQTASTAQRAASTAMAQRAAAYAAAGNAYPVAKHHHHHHHKYHTYTTPYAYNAQPVHTYAQNRYAQPTVQQGNRYAKYQHGTQQASRTYATEVEGEMKEAEAYKILGVEPHATKQEISDAYSNLWKLKVSTMEPNNVTQRIDKAYEIALGSALKAQEFYMDDLKFFGLKPGATTEEMLAAYQKLFLQYRPHIFENKEAANMLKTIHDRYMRLLDASNPGNVRNASIPNIVWQDVFDVWIGAIDYFENKITEDPIAHNVMNKYLASPEEKATFLKTLNNIKKIFNSRRYIEGAWIYLGNRETSYRVYMPSERILNGILQYLGVDVLRYDDFEVYAKMNPDLKDYRQQLNSKDHRHNYPVSQLKQPTQPAALLESIIRIVRSNAEEINRHAQSAGEQSQTAATENIFQRIARLARESDLWQAIKGVGRKNN